MRRREIDQQTVVHKPGQRSGDAAQVILLGRRAQKSRQVEVPVEERSAVQRSVKALLSVKHLAEYEDRLCDQEDAERALKHLHRAKPHWCQA